LNDGRPTERHGDRSDDGAGRGGRLSDGDRTRARGPRRRRERRRDDGRDRGIVGRRRRRRGGTLPTLAPLAVYAVYLFSRKGGPYGALDEPRNWAVAAALVGVIVVIAAAAL